MNLTETKGLKQRMSWSISCSRKRLFPANAKPDAKRQRVPEVTSDDSQTTLKYTWIAGQHIACFIVGGEARLCLPQLLRSVVDRVDVERLESTRRRLCVNLDQCDVRQLAVLHDVGVLPASAISCGLITLSDANRLVAALSQFIDVHRKWAWSLFLGDDVIDSDRKYRDDDVLPVCHACFGGCSGLLSRRWGRGGEVLVRCDECAAILSPEAFVVHTHLADTESRGTCHWGFDSRRWRHYVMLSTSSVPSEVDRRLQVALDDVKQLRDDQLQLEPIPRCLQVYFIRSLYGDNM